MATSQRRKSPNRGTPAPNNLYSVTGNSTESFRNKKNGNNDYNGNRKGGKMDKQMAVSKALSKLLRHAAEDVGLKLDSEAYARVDQVVSR